MTATQGNLASLSRYIFSAPDWPRSVGFGLLIAAVAGVGAFDSVGPRGHVALGAAGPDNARLLSLRGQARTTNDFEGL